MLDEVITVMEMNDTLVVCLPNLVGEQLAVGYIAAHLAGDVVPLHGKDGGVFVAVLLDYRFVDTIRNGEDLAIKSRGVAQ